MKVIIRHVAPTDQDWLNAIFSNQNVERSPAEVTMLNLSALPGFVAQVDGERVGVVSYQITPTSYEIIMLHSERPGLGIGRALVNSVLMEANDAKFKQVVAVARNGNEKAVSFYQGLGFIIANVRPSGGARLAPATPSAPAPTTSHDEIELVFKL